VLHGENFLSLESSGPQYTPVLLEMQAKIHGFSQNAGKVSRCAEWEKKRRFTGKKEGTVQDAGAVLHPAKGRAKKCRCRKNGSGIGFFEP
jgi:hypothetical protein